MKTVIIGAGISGLTAALTLKARGQEVTILEGNHRPGGVIHTLHRDGYSCESGPNALMLSSPTAVEFLQTHSLLDSSLQSAPTAKRRFVVQNNRLVELPTSPLAFALGSLLSWKAKARMMAEPFTARGTDPEESLASFVRRRLGSEVLTELVSPFVSGVYAGNPEELRVRHAFPKLYALEQKHGSLIRGAMHKGGATAPKGHMVSWRGGLSELVQSMAGKLGPALHLSTPVVSIRTEGGRYIATSENQEFETDRLILAVDALAASHLLAPLFPEIQVLKTIPYAPLCVLHLGFHRREVTHPLDGFGLLISRARGLRSLGAIFSSSLFPERAPPDHVLLTAFIGGMLDPEVLSSSDELLLNDTMKALGPLLGISRAPSFQNIVRWKRAIPQYESNHQRIASSCEKLEQLHPNLHLLGNFRHGISMNNCITSGYELALKIS